MVSEERSSKSSVYVLAALVFLCAALLVTASVLRVKNPNVKLRSATLNEISYNASSSFNATMIIQLSIKNPNYGGLFRYEDSNMRVLYQGVKFGDTEIHGGRVNVRETKRLNVMVNVTSVNIGDLSSDIESGTLNLTCNANFHGTIQLLKTIHKRKTMKLACIMSINLVSRSVQSIDC